jgi:hypothetical protein
MHAMYVTLLLRFLCVIILYPDSTSAELGTLNEALQELLDGIQVNSMLYNIVTLTLTPWWKEEDFFF